MKEGDHTHYVSSGFSLIHNFSTIHQSIPSVRMCVGHLCNRMNIFFFNEYGILRIQAHRLCSSAGVENEKNQTKAFQKNEKKQNYKCLLSYKMSYNDFVFLLLTNIVVQFSTLL